MTVSNAFEPISFIASSGVMLISIGQDMCCAFTVAENATLWHSNGEIGPTHLDYSSLNREQHLAPTMV